MVNLLNQTELERVPFLVEFEVSPEASPFLVTSRSGVHWVERTSKKGFIRAATRDREGIEADFLAEVCLRGLEQGWGNIHSLSEKNSVKESIRYLEYFGFNDWEILSSPVMDIDIGYPVQHCESLPPGCFVVVPKDRSFLGSLILIKGTQKAVGLIHNPSRGIAVIYEEHEGVASASSSTIASSGSV